MLLWTIAEISLWLAFAFSGSDAVAAVGCHGISNVDFRNLVIPATTYSGEPYCGGPRPWWSAITRRGVLSMDGGERDNDNRKRTGRPIFCGTFDCVPPDRMRSRVIVLESAGKCWAKCIKRVRVHSRVGVSMRQGFAGEGLRGIRASRQT
jgi:hypothetical protein